MPQSTGRSGISCRECGGDVITYEKTDRFGCPKESYGICNDCGERHEFGE